MTGIKLTARREQSSKMIVVPSLSLPGEMRMLPGL
jgi:hypothetical protein